MNTSYRQQLENALIFSQKIGIQNIQWNSINQESDESIQYVVQAMSKYINPFIESFLINNPYLGDACITLSANIFMILKAKGFNVEMIFGNVSINNSDVFPTTEEYLEYEYTNKVNEGFQYLHAWVGIGDNFIIDFAFPDRLWARHNYPQNIYVPFATDEYYEKNLNIKYKPMLIGTDFFKVTNCFDPLEKLHDLVFYMDQ